MDINLAAKTVASLGSINISTTVFTAYFTTLIAIVLLVYTVKNLQLIPGRLQYVIEQLFTAILDLVLPAYKEESYAKKHFPLYISLFFFLIIANQFSVIPLINSITASNGFLFQPSTTDLSQTLTLTFITLGVSHIVALSISPLGHIFAFIKIRPLFQARSFLQIINGLFEFALGILDIVGELAKIASLSVRLFGNMFAGMVMIIVISNIAAFTGYFIPIPFLGLGILSGFVQAFVFTILSIQFISSHVNNALEEREKHKA